MWTINKPIIKKSVVETTETATLAEIAKYDTDINFRTVNVKVQYKKDDGTVLSEEFFTIFGDNYDLLMSESPEFAPGKPENDYRVSDLEYVIKKIQVA